MELSTNSILKTSALLHATFHNNSDSNNSTTHVNSDISSSSSPEEETETETEGLMNSSNGGTTSGSSFNGHPLVIGTTPMSNNSSFRRNRKIRNVSPDSTTGTSSDDAAMLPSLIGQVVDPENSIEISSPLGTPREVPFDDDMPQFSLSDNEDDLPSFPYEKESKYQQDIQAELNVLHEQLKNTLADLSAEKAVRHRKEKSLVKLAKELNKRTLEADEHERKMAQKTSTLKQLQAAVVADHERYASHTKESNERIATLEQDVDTMRTKLYASQLSIDGLQNQLATANKVNRSQRLYGWLWTLVVIGSVTMGATLLGSHPSFFILSTRNSLCAPVRPGTTLFANSAPDQQSTATGAGAAGATNTLSSPWWAPSSSKSTMYNLLCRHNDAVPIRMEWKGDKIQLLDRDSDSVLFQSRASEGVTVHADRIHIGSTSRQRKKGGLVVDAVVAAPWAIQW